VTPAYGSPSFDALLVGGYGEYEDGDVDNAALVQVRRLDDHGDPVGEPECRKHITANGRALYREESECCHERTRPSTRLSQRHSHWERLGWDELPRVRRLGAAALVRALGHYSRWRKATKRPACGCGTTYRRIRAATNAGASAAGRAERCRPTSSPRASATAR
jgi:hypothetical protein